MRRLFVLLFSLVIFSNVVGAEPMDLDIRNKVVSLFVHTDQREWKALKDVFANKVLLDYSSFTQNPAAELTPDQIITAWSGFLPGFSSTQHHISNMLVERSGSTAKVFCYGSASHCLPNDSGNNVWLVVGTYDFELIESTSGWKISAMTFNFKYQDGNTDLPKLIQ